MDPNDSFADTVSTDYKWVKDSLVSHNHPTVNSSNDKSTFVRSHLDTVRKEKVRRMAKLLDEYKSPVGRTAALKLLDHGEDKSELFPQAASSPKSDVPLLHSSSVHGRATPALTHRSMSPTPTSSQTMSWQKHSMRPQSANPSPRSCLNESLQTLATLDKATSVSTSAKYENQKGLQSNFRPAQIAQIEDSYWTGSKPFKDQLQMSEVTPSPVRIQHQQFYTAKQFHTTEDDALVVESLRITTPKLGQSPSNGCPASIPSLKPSCPDRSRDSYDQDYVREPNSTSARSSSPIDDQTIDFQTNAAIRGDISRSNSSCNSELSKVNSQATSLQQAISLALKNDTSDADREKIDDQLEHLPIEDAIAARYRRSRTERSHTTTTAQNFGESDAPQLHPKAGSVPVVEPVKHASPLLTRRSPTPPESPMPSQLAQPRSGLVSPIVVTASQDASGVRSEERLQVTELVSTLERVTEECSRRGTFIDSLLEKIDSTVRISDQEHQQALTESENKQRLLEAQLSKYELRMQQMSESLNALQVQQEEREKQAKRSLCEAHQDRPLPSTGRESRLHSPAAPITSLGTPHSTHSQEMGRDVGESFQEKIDRWDREPDSIAPARSMDYSETLIRVKEMLDRTPAVLKAMENVTNGARPGTASPSRKIINDSVVSPILPTSASRCQNEGGTGPASEAAQPVDPTVTSLRRELERANDELVRLRSDRLAAESSKVSVGAREPLVRPLTAQMMPDARDPTVGERDKLYVRLQLGDIDRLEQNEVCNLLKNILIQLDVPFGNLSTTISALAAKLAVSEDHVHETLVKEVSKLREFAENIHATVYDGEHIEGVITSRRCLNDMYGRVGRLHRAVYRRKSGRSGEA